MATRTRITGFTRFLLVLALMAALFFGVQYALTNTEWGRDLHLKVQEAVPQESNVDN